MDAKTLEALAARCEGAQGADHVLDNEIARAICPGATLGPAYTASLDAAMTLVPKGWQIDPIRSYWTVDGVEDSVVIHPAFTTPVRGIWLYLIGAPAHCDARCFRKVVSDIEEADEQFTALIKRPVRQRVPVATPGDRP